MPIHSELYEAVADAYPEQSISRNAFESIFNFYELALHIAAKETPEALQNAKRVGVLAAGPVGHFDALALAILLPHAQISVTDLDVDLVSNMQDKWESTMQDISRREVRSELGSRITFGVADATQEEGFREKNDITIVRNPGGFAPHTYPPESVNIELMLETARKITKSGGLLLVTSKFPKEAERHDQILQNQPVSMIYNKPTTGTRVMGFVGDIHLFAARVH